MTEVLSEIIYRWLGLISDIDTNAERFVSLANIDEKKMFNLPELRSQECVFEWFG